MFSTLVYYWSLSWNGKFKTNRPVSRFLWNIFQDILAISYQGDLWETFSMAREAKCFQISCFACHSYLLSPPPTNPSTVWNILNMSTYDSRALPHSPEVSSKNSALGNLTGKPPQTLQSKIVPSPLSFYLPTVTAITRPKIVLNPYIIGRQLPEDKCASNQKNTNFKHGTSMPSSKKSWLQSCYTY